MTLEMRNCLKQLSRMFNGLKSIEPGDDEYLHFHETMTGLNISGGDLQAWSVSDFKNKRPPTEKQLRGMLVFCKKWDENSNNFDMRFKVADLDAFETAINDFVFLGSVQGGDNG